ncbi:MAG: EAL domain-containing protein [Methylococcaceae bacterium]|nr:MAG: EAL domain-containing protein [Methylococcaceae bacterium]
MQQENILFARQPILNSGSAIVGYELLFRSDAASSDANVTNDLSASTDVIVNAICQFGIDNALGWHQGFINVSYELLMSDLLELLPPKRVVLEILPSVKINDSLINRCRELKSKGFQLALDDFNYAPHYDPLLDQVDIVKLDVLHSAPTAITQSLQVVERYGHIRGLADKVEDPAQFQYCRSAGFSLFQGYFFARPIPVSGKKINPNQTALLRILSMLLADADSGAIEQVFKGCPYLSVSLLRLVNSVGMGVTQKIGSLRQALCLLGRRQLLRWVQLLLYAPNAATEISPLLQLAAVRARLMESIAALCVQNCRQAEQLAERAFMVGILSKADVLFGDAMEALLSPLGLIDEVKAAILDRTGLLGDLLTLAEHMETGDFNAAAALIKVLGVSPTDLTAAQSEAMHWADNLGKEEH